MIEIAVSMSGDAVRETLQAVSASVSPEACAAAAAEAAADIVRDNFITLSRARHRPGQRLNYYLQAADSVIRETHGAEALVRIPHTGIALRFHGGTVKPTGRTSKVTGRPITRLAIGLSGTPGEGHVPADFADLFVIPTADGDKAVLARKSGVGVQALFALVSEATQLADPTVLPADAAMLDAAVRSILDLYDAATESRT